MLPVNKVLNQLSTIIASGRVDYYECDTVTAAGLDHNGENETSDCDSVEEAIL